MRQLLSYTRRAIEDFSMIEAGDRILVGLSGGKDSLCALVALRGLQRFYPKPFTLHAATLDMGFEGADFSPLADFCEKLGVPFTLYPTQMAQILFDIRREKNPCALCAKMRRGHLSAIAHELSCNKVALGHHRDDAAETLLMSLFFEGRLHCFSPITYLDRADLTQIRPLIYAGEAFLSSFCKKNALPLVKNPCPANGHTKRQEIKEMIASLEARYPKFEQRLFGALVRSDLQGWLGKTAEKPPL